MQENIFTLIILSFFALGWVGFLLTEIYKIRKMVSYDGEWILLKEINTRLLRNLLFNTYDYAKSPLPSGLKL